MNAGRRKKGHAGETAQSRKRRADRGRPAGAPCGEGRGDSDGGGWAPKGWETEDGPAPWLAEFGLEECPRKGYPARTEANARDSDVTVWFGSTDSTGYRATANACRKHGKPCLVVEEGATRPSDVAAWVEAHQVETLNVAGNRESKNPGLGARVEAFLARVFTASGDAGPP